MLGKTAHAPEVGHVSDREHQVVKGDLVRVRMETGTGAHQALVEINSQHLPHMHLGPRDKLPHGAHGVRETDGSRDDLGQHRLKGEVVVLADEHDLEVVALP